MTDRASLPQFVREALEEDRPEGHSAGELREQSADALAAERSFAALLDATWPRADASSDKVAPGGVWPIAGEAAQGSSALFERLESTLREPPHRYAPFFARAAELLDLPEEAAILELARLKDPKVWRFAGLPGIHNVTVAGGPRVEAAETLFVRFAPGVYFPRHSHTGLERVLVLEGSYRDSNGVEHRAGELREWVEGTEHAFRVDRSEPCIFASVVFGRRFQAWPLRALAKLLGR